MTLTEKWEQFKAEQKAPNLLGPNLDRVPEPVHKIPDIPAVQKIGSSSNIRDLVFARITDHTLIIAQMTEAMERDGIEYSVRRHLIQARLAEAKAILKLMEQDNADQNS
jgi:hypothetical protein